VKLLALARSPVDAEAAARALAEATGLTPAEARMRLAPEPPALLARLDPPRADAAVATMRKAGAAALAIDVRVPSDDDRTVARAFSIGDAGATFTPRSGAPLDVAWPDVLAVLRGARALRADVARAEKSRSVSIGSAVATGGLLVTRTSTKTVRSSEEATEQVILVYSRDGRAAALAEGGLDFSCLGAAMQPSSTANMVALAAMLRDRAKGAFHDDRLLRLGRRSLPFLAGGESRSQTATLATTRTDTSGSLDVLAEVIRQALVEGLLP
jgi:hypothetical protein